MGSLLFPTLISPFLHFDQTSMNILAIGVAILLITWVLKITFEEENR